MATQLTESQIQILASIVEGDVVSFKRPNAKSFGAKHTVVKVTRDTEFDVSIWTLPIKETRTKGIPGYSVNNQGKWQYRVFYPYNEEQTRLTIQKH